MRLRSLPQAIEIVPRRWSASSSHASQSAASRLHRAYIRSLIAITLLILSCATMIQIWAAQVDHSSSAAITTTLQRSIAQRIARRVLDDEPPHSIYLRSDLRALESAHESASRSMTGDDSYADEAQLSIDALRAATQLKLNRKAATIIASERVSRSVEHWVAWLQRQNQRQIERATLAAYGLALFCSCFIFAIGQRVFRPLTDRLRLAEEKLEHQVESLERSNSEMTIARAYAEREREFSEAVLGVASCLVCVVDREGRFVRFNKACEKLTGWSANEVMGKVFVDVVVPQEERAETMAAFRHLQAGHFPDVFTNHWMTLSGERRKMHWESTALCDADGAVEFVISTGTDITARVAAEQQIERQMLIISETASLLSAQRVELQAANLRLEGLVMQDGLTHIANRRAFDAELEKVLGDPHEPVALVLLDIDSFKSFNDTFGHLAGDETLITVARILSSALQPGEFVARYGGEEMALILPIFNPGVAYRRCEAFRKAIEAHPWELRPITASLGLALAAFGDRQADALILAADAALYRSKGAGRNCTTLASDLLDLSSAA